MREESTTPDLVERVRRMTEAVNRQDHDALMSFYAPDVVFDFSQRGIGIFEGAAACRTFNEEYWASFEDLAWRPEQILVLDEGVVLALVGQKARPLGSAAPVHTREAWVMVFSADGMLTRLSTYSDIEKAHAAAGRLAGSRFSC